MSKEQSAGLVEEPSVATGGPDTRRGRAPEQKGDGAGGASQTEQAGPPRGVLREYFESLVVTAIMALFGMTFVVQAVKVPTGSMQNTILVGDHLLVNKFIFAPGPVMPFLPQREIRRGDIIVFKYPGKFQSPQFADNPEVDDNDPDNQPFKINYVKRVIGLPGDRIEEDEGGRLLVNGQPLAERRRVGVDPGTGLPNEHPLHDAPLKVEDAPPSGEGPYDVFYRPETVAAPEGTLRGETFTVPEGHYFVMGDNRDHSLDSRFWGYVPRHLVIGRAMFVYWSFDESLPRGQGSLGFLSDFFGNTRWSRTGTLIK
ncbi:MAG TPA: signal peptidase I [Pyrinomonadaceae bacterium]|nr:signal peptidase I [Pyrinomonadaceae bacterium]